MFNISVKHEQPYASDFQNSFEKIVQALRRVKNFSEKNNTCRYLNYQQNIYSKKNYLLVKVTIDNMIL
jgi:hypothetical protein